MFYFLHSALLLIQLIAAAYIFVTLKATARTLNRVKDQQKRVRELLAQLELSARNSQDRHPQDAKCSGLYLDAKHSGENTLVVDPPKMPIPDLMRLRR